MIDDNDKKEPQATDTPASPAQENKDATSDEPSISNTLVDEEGDIIFTAPEPQDTQKTSPDPSSPEALEARIAELNDQLLRSLAEVENIRRRADRARIEAQTYGITRFARDILEIADNLERALTAFPATARDELPENALGLLTGVEATQRSLQAAFTRHKITPIDPKGEKFDPNLHEAMYDAPSDDVPAGIVIEIIERGYMLDERLLRPARVGVSKGPVRVDAAKEKPENSIN